METKELVAVSWTRKPQERNDQKYFFSGRFYFTKGVFEELQFDEIAAIYNDVRTFAKERKGIDYLQVYIDAQGRQLYFIDQLNRRQIESGEYGEQHNYCTLLWSHEY